MKDFSTLDLFKIGIGPSSSHTVGPMKAAYEFLQKLSLKAEDQIDLNSIECSLHGSLGATGKGHGSGKAVILGLMGMRPETVDVDKVCSIIDEVVLSKKIRLGFGLPVITFDPKLHIRYLSKPLPEHPNGIKLAARDRFGEVLFQAIYISTGGGFIRALAESNESSSEKNPLSYPLPFNSAEELLQQTQNQGAAISDLMRQHEYQWRSETELDLAILNLWNVMQECIWRGCRSSGTLPGPFAVKRRAPDLFRQLNSENSEGYIDISDPLKTLDWVNLFALAVNEENAAGGRVVTAPTNGAAGIIPAVLGYFTHFVPGATDKKIINFFLTSAAIGFLYKRNASLSGAEVGCQGEVGVACSMAAGGLCEVLGGTPEQVENAAEIAMEHHLGLTCDPVGGLVQIPCIERNAIGSVKAINSARIALRGNGSHRVSLDKVIKTMRETGADMKTKYKETARGGLAVNIVEC